MVKVMPGFEFAERIQRIDSAVRQGTVDFSTTILERVETRAIVLVADSMYAKSAAKPRPCPDVFVGVLTEMKMMSASSMALSTSVEKNRLRPRHA